MTKDDVIDNVIDATNDVVKEVVEGKSKGKGKGKKKIIKILLIIVGVILFLILGYFLYNLSQKGIIYNLDLEEVYNYLNFDNISLNSRLTFRVKTNGCTLDGEYDGDRFRNIKTHGSNERCKDFKYEMGDDPNEFTEDLIEKDIMESNQIK